MSVDINKVRKFIISENFTKFLLDNNDDVDVPAFILQAIYEKIDRCKEGTK